MKYKVGDKFLVEIVRANENFLFPYSLENGILMTEENLDKLRRPDDMNAEAWEVARKIILQPDKGGYTGNESEEIFGTFSGTKIFENNTWQQAKAKIEAWEAEKEIKVGDVVTWSHDENGVVARIDGELASAVWGDGSCGEWECKKLQKIGRHIDIQSVLEQIGG